MVATTGTCHRVPRSLRKPIEALKGDAAVKMSLQTCNNTGITKQGEASLLARCFKKVVSQNLKEDGTEPHIAENDKCIPF